MSFRTPKKPRERSLGLKRRTTPRSGSVGRGFGRRDKKENKGEWRQNLAPCDNIGVISDRLCQAVLGHFMDDVVFHGLCFPLSPRGGGHSLLFALRNDTVPLN